MTTPSANATERSLDSRVIDVVIRLAFLGLLAYWAGVIVGPFVAIVIWAVILAVALHPVYAWLKARLGGKGSIASWIITLAFLGVILGPTVLLATSVVDTAKTISGAIENEGLLIPPPSEAVRGWPLIGEQAYSVWSQASDNLSSFITSNRDLVVGAGRKAAGAAAGLGAGVLSFTLSVIIAAFLYGGGPKMAEAAGRFAERIAAGRGREFVSMAGATIRNVARGVIGISLIQATLAGVGMLAAGVPAAGLLTFAILMLCIVQLGPTLVVIGSLVWVWSNADAMTAALFTAYIVPVNFLDNVLKPIVMAKGLKTPMLVIFIGVIGGTLAHGLMGLFLGPVILAVFYDLARVWVSEAAPGEAREDGEAAVETL